MQIINDRVENSDKFRTQNIAKYNNFKSIFSEIFSIY